VCPPDDTNFEDILNHKKPAARERGRLAFHSSARCRGYLFGHSQPLEQSWQHEQSHLQLGQSLQQSFVQQAPVLQRAGSSVTAVDGPTMPAANKALPRSRPLNSFTIIENSLS
jgi:hypothetical protein